MKNTFLPFKEAREKVRALGLKSVLEWSVYSKSKRPPNVPSSPICTYKNSGWISWIDFLGSNGRRRNERLYKVNDNFFSRWSSDMAYILGFWWADGYISDGRFGITQHINDISLLKKISKKMKSNYKIYIAKKRPNTAEIRIASSAIINDLLKLGGDYRKSLICKFPYVPKKYLPDFVRGCWDGDGCIYYNNHQKGYMAVYSSGSKKFIERLLSVLRKNIADFRGGISTIYNKKGYKICNIKMKKDSTNYQLVLGANDTRRLKNFMYYNDNILKMDRKWKKFKLVGNINLSTREKIFLSYDLAIKIIKKQNIKNIKEWRKYCSSGKKPNNIPSVPFKIYKNKGWVDWHHWLGKKKYFLNYNEAIKYVRKLKIKNTKEWGKYCKSNKKPYDIPSCPRIVYRNRGWKSSYHWFGNNGWKKNNRWLKIKFLSFEKARKIVRMMKLINNKEWRKSCQCEKIERNIPRNPDVYYKKKGWVSWGNWLGTNKKVGGFHGGGGKKYRESN